MRDTAIAAWVLVENGQMTNRSFASSRNLSPTTVTLYRRLGICLMEMRLDPDQEPKLWRALGGAMAITSAPVREAIERRVPLLELRRLVAEEAAA